MYYKITNTQCDLYKELRTQREKELAAIAENKALLAQHIPYAYQKFAGFTDQGVRRIPIPVGFYFIHPEEVDLKVWREDCKREGLYYPSKRTKKGKEMQQFLDSLKSFSAHRLWDKLGVEYIGEFYTPFMELAKDVIVIRLDDKQQPKGEDIIEITRQETLELLGATEKEQQS